MRFAVQLELEISIIRSDFGVGAGLRARCEHGGD